MGGCETNLLNLAVRLRGGSGICSAGGRDGTEVGFTANADELKSREEERCRADGRLLGAADGRRCGRSGEDGRGEKRRKASIWLCDQRSSSRLYVSVSNTHVPPGRAVVISSRPRLLFPIIISECASPRPHLPHSSRPPHPRAFSFCLYCHYQIDLAKLKKRERGRNVQTGR